MNWRIHVLLFTTVFILLGILFLVVFGLIPTGTRANAVGEVANTATPGNATSGVPNSSSEERVARLIERQLDWLNTVLAIVGSVFAALGVVFVVFSAWIQYRDHQRQTSLDKQTHDFVARSATQAETSAQHMYRIMEGTGELITSVKRMSDLAAKGQQLAEKIEKERQAARREKRQQLQRLDADLRLLAEGAHTRFNKSELALWRSAAEGVNRIRYTWGARDNELPAAAHLVCGLDHSVNGNYRSGAEDFRKVIDHKRATPKQKEIAFYNRGINHASLGQYDLAIKDFEMARGVERDEPLLPILPPGLPPLAGSGGESQYTLAGEGLRGSRQGHPRSR